MRQALGELTKDITITDLSVFQQQSAACPALSSSELFRLPFLIYSFLKANLIN